MTGWALCHAPRRTRRVLSGQHGPNAKCVDAIQPWQDNLSVPACLATAMALASLAPLDGLSQLVIVEPSCFALYSAISPDQSRWEVFLALQDHGRWWMGSWSEGDVRAMVGSRATENDIHALATSAKLLIAENDVEVTGWSPGLERGAGLLQLRFGPSGDKPLRISLEELSAEDAALQASRIVFSLLQRSREGTRRLVFPPTPASTSTPFSSIGSSSSLPVTAPTSLRPSTPVVSSRVLPLARPSSPSPVALTGKPTSSAQPSPTVNRDSHPASVKPVEKGQEEESDDDLVPRIPTKPTSSPKKKPISKIITPKRPASGASLSNPNKRARRVVSLEFEDDD